MKTTSLKKKLSLNKNTVARLAKPEMCAAIGGGPCRICPYCIQLCTLYGCPTKTCQTCPGDCTWDTCNVAMCTNDPNVGCI